MSAPAIRDAVKSGDSVELAQALIERLAPVVDDPATADRDLSILCLRLLELIRVRYMLPVRPGPRLVAPLDR